MKDAHKETPEKNPAGEAPETVLLPRVEYEALTAQLQEAKELKDRLMRSAADYENAKKRLVRERDEFVKFSQESLLRGLLPVFDNLERAFSHAGSDSSPAFKNLAAGIQMVLKQFAEIFKNQGLVRVESVGKQFDPHVHEAVGYVKEKGRDHEILDEIEAGYLLGGKLLRAAKVRVRISDEPSAPPADSGS